jgi:hypothetical protein
MTTIVFGALWDAPICDDALLYPELPTHARCLRCHEQIAEGDQGFIRPYIGELDPEYLVDDDYLTAVHRECDLTGIVGHMVGVCSCTGWDTEARETGREVLRRVQAGALARPYVPPPR